MDEIFNKLLSSLTESSIITEDVAKDYKEMFELKLEEKLTSIDEAATEKLLEVKSFYEDKLESFDEEAAEKLTEVKEFFEDKLESFDEEAAEKLVQVRDLYESKIEDTKVEDITDKVDTYLEAYLDECMPEDVLAESVTAAQSTEVIDKIKELLCINEAVVNEEIREAIIDGKEQLDAKAEEAKALFEENMQLKLKLNKVNSKSLLEEKTKHLSPGLKSHVETLFEDASDEKIEEKFDEAVEAYLGRMKRRVSKSGITNPKVILEDKQNAPTPNNGVMAAYVARVKSSQQFYNTNK